MAQQRLGSHLIGTVMTPLTTPIRRGRRSAGRRLAAVMSVDIKGYSLLMVRDEEDTHGRVGAALSRLVRHIEKSHGRVFSFSGDGVMAEFPSAVEALRCALRVQAEAGRRNTRVGVERRIEYRIGINSGDVVDQDGRMGGDAVNIAARLEQIGQAGSITISTAVFDQVGRVVTAHYECLGPVALKNIRQTVTIYRVTGTAAASRAEMVRVPDPVTDYRPSLAVLPFRTMRADQADAYFAAGMVDDIIHGLGGLRELLVIARGSTLNFVGPSVDLRRVGAELGVRYVLHGSVRQSGERLRIVAELSETESASTLWADRFDGVLADLFELQDSISLRVAAIIAPQVRERELRRAMRKRPESMTAYDLVLQALDLLHRNVQAPFLQAGDLLRQAIVDDPDYAPSYSHMALWYMLRVAQGWSENSDEDGRAAAAVAEAAIARDPHDAQALAICGHTQSYMYRNYTAASALLDRALLAGPNCAIAWSLSSLTCGYLGDGKAAVQRAEHGLRLSPLAPDAYMYEHFLSLAHYVNGDNEASVTWARKSLAHNPTHASTLRTLIAALVSLGRLDEARDGARQLVAQSPNFSLAGFASRTPLPERVRERFLDDLRQAGVPD